MKKISNILFCLFCLLSVSSQATDSLFTLSPAQVLEIVKQYHPVARQADILVKKAQADVTIAKGMFDPLLGSKFSNKSFDGLKYYRHFQGEIIIPTWFGIELNAGLENLTGDRTDPQETLGRTSFAGFTVPLAKNLLIDKRRATKQQAKIYLDLSETEKKKILNDLFLDVMQSYWDWFKNYQVLQVISNVVTVNEIRFEFVKNEFLLGSCPAIDTTEALSQLQNFKMFLNKATLEFRNAGLQLSQFLWNKQGDPVILPENVVPDSSVNKTPAEETVLPLLDDLLLLARTQHPELAGFQFKLDALTVEKRYKFQEILPEINFTYNQLGKGYDLMKTAAEPLLENNFRYGISVGIPVRLSKGRGEFRKIKLEISEMELQQDLKRMQIENKIRTVYNELLMIKEQIILQRDQYKNLLRLKEGEEIRFFNGESSLFLVNNREIKTIEAMEKIAELESHYYITLNKVLWASGSLAP